MSKTPRSSKHRKRLRRALEEVRQMRAKLEKAQSERRQPIAIIGMGCRLPGGVHNPDDLWNLLSAGGDAIRPVPASRWDIDAWYDPDPDAAGKVVSRCGGFLDHVDKFDPQFFGIAPREADYLDPQQRLLLEVSWESLEQAAIAPDRLRATPTGVFVGISSGEYGELLTAAGPESIHHHLGSGNANSIAAGRISFALDLLGPALAIDTACSSSLVAVDLACRSLRSGQCNLALAGGVNVLLTPTITINHSRARMLAPDGRCKTFDASADGFVRSEGCALVVLKRLDDAQAEGDQILAVIRGTATNQDGHTSGLTVPNGPSQEAVIVRAQQDAGVSPDEVDYVEAHGTGTSLGDPIELNALKNVFASGRRADRPLLVGSLKTNIGHAEAAAGIAGLVKVVLSLRHETIPPHLHFQRPTPHFDWESSPLRVPCESTAWTSAEGRPRLAGLSSFGFGGTNAHLIVEEAPAVSRPDSKASQADGLWLLPLSARSDQALRQLADRYAAHFGANPHLRLNDVCRTAGIGRSHFRHRAAVMAGSLHQAAERLLEVAGHRTSKGVIHNIAGVDAPKIAFLFTGQGSHYAGMGSRLYECEPVFREEMQRCDELLRPHLDVPLLDLIDEKGANGGQLDKTLYSQPALFALGYSLAELWASWGIEPDFALGHSLGEYTAACRAGVFSLEDGLRLVAARARLMQQLPGDGAMAAVLAGHRPVAAAIERYAPEVSIAAINGPRNTVVSGRKDHVEELLGRLGDDGLESQPLSVSHAFHSQMIEPVMAEFAEVASQVACSPPHLELASNLTGRLFGDSTIDADYLCRHMRQPVLFSEGIRTLLQQGCRLFIELGPKPVLSGLGRHCATDVDVKWLASLRPGRPDQQQLLECLAEAYALGAEIRWSGLYPQGHPVELPTYPFQRRRHWAAAQSSPAGPNSGLAPKGRTEADPGKALLGDRIDCAERPHEVVFQYCLDGNNLGFLDQHRIFGRSIMPASAYLTMARAAAASVLGTGRLDIRDVSFHEAIVLAEGESKTVQLLLGRSDSTWKVYSYRDHQADPVEWTLHASGRVQVHSADDPDGTRAEDLGALQEVIDQPLACDDFYKAYGERGLEFGPLFQLLKRLWFSDTQALGQIEVPSRLTGQGADGQPHPALLDAAAQVVGAVRRWRERIEDGDLWLQAGIEQYRIHRPPGGKLWAHAKLRSTDGQQSMLADVRLLDESGQLVAEILGQQARPVGPADLVGTSSSRAGCYVLEWVPQAEPEQIDDKLLRQWSKFPGQAAVELNARLSAALARPALADYAHLLGELESLATTYLCRALEQMGWASLSRGPFEPDEWMRHLGVLPHYSRLFDRLLEMLETEGILRRKGARWEAVGRLACNDLRQRVADMQQRWPSSPELELLKRCGMRLADVLRGDCQPLPLIFPDGDIATAARVYDSPGARAMSELLASGIAQALERLPEDRPLRILEIGAGTGGTTSYVLPRLPAQRTQYVFSDISRHFLQAARRKFARFGFVRYKVLDIERSPAVQGLDGAPFDLIIASNVLHATRDLDETVRHVGQLLSSGGLLWLVENIVPSGWVELIWGLTDGWWRFDDDVRTSHPLLTEDGWQRLLQKRGFADVGCIAADAGRHGHLSRQAIIVGRLGSVRPDALPSTIRSSDSADRRPAAEVDNRQAPLWLILADSGGLADDLAASLSALGNRCVQARRAKGFKRHSKRLFDVDPLRRADFERLIQKAGGQGHPLQGVLHMWRHEADPESLALSEVGTRVHENCMGLVHLVQALAAQSFQTPAKLWLITDSGQPVPGSVGLRLDQGPLWTLGQVIALEHPNLWGGMLDLDSNARSDATAIISELFHNEGEDQVAFRGGDRFMPRLVKGDAPPGTSLKIRSDATYMITGGCGAFGLKAAAGLVERGAQHIVLVGRAGAETPAARQGIESLQAAGAEVLVAKADVTDQEALSGLFRQLAANWPELAGIVHAAGLPGYCPLLDLDSEAVLVVLAAKVIGTCNLHQLAKSLDLDFFVLCSSMVSLWGAKGQGHYGAANHFLDVFAHYRRGLGLPGLSVNWGPLTGGGMLAAEDVPELKRMGISTTTMDQAVSALFRLLGSDVVQTAIVDIDWPRFTSLYESKGKRPLFAQLGAFERSGGPQAWAARMPDADSILEQLRSAPPSECREMLTGHVSDVLSSILGLVEPPDHQTGFFDMGMDSLSAIEFRRKLEATLDLHLPPTLAFDYTSIEALTDFLASKVRPSSGSERDTAMPPLQPAADRAESRTPDISQLTDEEVETLLTEKLERLGYAQQSTG